MFGDTEAGTMPASAAATRVAECVDDGASCIYSVSTLSVLFVDDLDADAARIFQALSACRDFRVAIDHVSDPEEARRLWDRGIHDIAIFDIWLGRGTSIALLSALAKEAATRPVIILSNLPNAEARTIAGDSRDLMVHSKDNISPAALAMTLASALALSRRSAVTLHA